MSSPFLYAGVNPAVWQMLRDGALARGQGEPRQVPRRSTSIRIPWRASPTSSSTGLPCGCSGSWRKSMPAAAPSR